MKEEPLISVIVPVYNTEQYLHQCVDSILAQSYSNLEVILVDDGSTDFSGKICDEYQRRDGRVRVIHKTNGGNTSARKAGLEIAGGEYVAFVDSDDWIEEGMYEQLLLLAQKYHTDIVESGYYLDYGNISVEKKSSLPAGLYEQGQNYRSLIDNLIQIDGMGWRSVASYLWNKLLRRTMIEDILKNEKDSLQYAEDAICTWRMVLRSARIYVARDTYYHYRMRVDSITHKRDDRYFSKINEFYLEAKCILVEHPEYQQALMSQLGVQMAQMVVKGFNENFDFGIEVYLPAYIMPELDIAKASRVILYGAGRVGKDYYRSLADGGTYQLVAWLDGNADQYQESNHMIEPPEAIHSYEFDYIILAALRESTAESMMDMLSYMGINRAKMIWRQPQEVLQINNLYKGWGKKGI